MTDIARVTVAKDALSSLQESINIGKEVLQRKLSAYQKKIVEFEKAKNTEGNGVGRVRWGRVPAKYASPQFHPPKADKSTGLVP